MRKRIREWIATLPRKIRSRANLFREERVIVLGQQAADATAAERHRSQRLGPSSAPFFNPGYNSWRGDGSLIWPAASPVDDKIRELCRSYVSSGDSARAQLRDSLHMNDFYTFITFARRSTVFALREQRAEILQDGIIAISMIEKDRVDFRDVLWCLAIVHHGMKRLGVDAAQQIRRAAALAEPGVSGLVTDFLQQSDEYRDLRASWGFDEVQTAGGIGFIGWGSRKYTPTIDLKSVALEIADAISRDKYMPGAVEVATELPPFWLSGNDDLELKRILGAVQGGATISGRLRPGEFPQHEQQQFTVFVVQTNDASQAGTLCRLAETTTPKGCHRLGLAAANLFCLIVARSFVEGAAAFETQRSLARFSDPISQIISHYAHSASG